MRAHLERETQANIARGMRARAARGARMSALFHDVRGAGPDAHEQGVLRDAFDVVRADETVREVAR